MTKMNETTRREVLATGAMTTAALTGFVGTAVAEEDSDSDGGAGFTFTEPTVDEFTLTGLTNDDLNTAYFQRGCGDNGDLEPYEKFYAVDSFDGDGETDRLYPHPNNEDIGGEGDTFKINTYCETEAFLNFDRPGYWLTYSPV